MELTVSHAFRRHVALPVHCGASPSLVIVQECLPRFFRERSCRQAMTRTYHQAAQARVSRKDTINAVRRLGT